LSTGIKLMRLMGAGMVTLAVVPWLGVSPAAASQGDHGRSTHNAQGQKTDAKRPDANKAAAKKPDANKADARKAAAKKPDANKADARKAAAKKPAKEAGKAKSEGMSKTERTSGPHATGNQKVTLCHRTNSDNNPYVVITVSINSVIKGAGHDGHNGPVYQPGMKSAGQKWGDIIPSFTYTNKDGSSGSYAGKNWPAGQALFNVGCEVSGSTPSETVSPTETSTATGTETPTVTASPTVTVTETVTVTPTTTSTVTQPGPTETVTSTAPETTTPGSTVTVTETVTAGETPGASVLPTKIGGGGNGGGGVLAGGEENGSGTAVLGTKTGVLPHTGLDLPLGAVLGLSFVLLLAGGAMMFVPSRLAVERGRRH
jgi:hypothetical protein